MPFPLAPQIALAAIQGLIKFRDRLDTILSLAAAADPLPFRLPDAGYEYAPSVQPMLEFFGAPDRGKPLLELRGLRDQFDEFLRDPGRLQDRNELVRAYWEATGLPPQVLGPDESESDRRRRQSSLGIADEQDRRVRLAYFVVESHRLSRNTKVTRVLLAAAQTIVEVAGANAEWFISDKRTASFVQTLIQEFAGDGFEIDDAPAARIFSRILGAAAAAAVEHRGQLPDQPVLAVLLEALADLKKEKGDDFVAGLVSRDGFERLVGRMLVRAADTPGLLPDQPALREALTAMLRKAGENFPSLARDPALLAGVVEAGIAAAIDPATEILGRKLGDQPLVAVVLDAVAKEIGSAAGKSVLFSRIAGGEMVASLYGASLRAVAANPELLQTTLGIDRFATKLIAGLADELADAGPAKAFTPETLRTLAIRGLETLAETPEFLGLNDAFATRVLGATIGSLAATARDGLTRDDLLEVVEVTLRTVAGSLQLTRMDDRLRIILTAVTGVLGDQGLKSLTDARGRKAVSFAVLEAVAANAVIWDGFAHRDLVQPLLQAVLHAFANDPSGLLSGPALVPAMRQVLAAAARRGESILAGSARPDHLGTVLLAALTQAREALGRDLDGETLPAFLGRVVLEFLRAPFDPATGPLAALLDQALVPPAAVSLPVTLPPTRGSGSATRSSAAARTGKVASTRNSLPGSPGTRSARSKHRATSSAKSPTGKPAAARRRKARGSSR